MTYLAERAERELSNWWDEDACRDMIRRAYAADGFPTNEVVASELAAVGMTTNQAVDLMDMLDEGRVE